MTLLSSSGSKPDATLPISAFSYRNVGIHTPEIPFANGHDSAPRDTERAKNEITQQEVDWLVQAARQEAIAETEARMQTEMDTRVASEQNKTHQAITSFQEEQKRYFERVEAEVVQLSLAIAARILHREAQVDPMLVTGLVRVAIEKLHKGSSVTVRTAPADAAKWRERVMGLESAYEVKIVEDADIPAQGCVLETELGLAEFSLEAQLKEVERGFFDLLALRPQS